MKKPYLFMFGWLVFMLAFGLVLPVCAQDSIYGKYRAEDPESSMLKSITLNQDGTCDLDIPYAGEINLDYKVSGNRIIIQMYGTNIIFERIGDLLTGKSYPYSGETFRRKTPNPNITLSEDTVFGLHGFFGLIVNNKVQFYFYDEYGSEEWQYGPQLDMTLPTGSKSVFLSRFGSLAALGVMVNNKVQFYTYDGSWKYRPEYDLTLPAGSKNMFLSDYGLGVIVNNKVQFYAYEDGSWKYRPEYDMALPAGYKSVSYYYYGLGVIVNNKVQFYAYENRSWKYRPEYNMTLPAGYKSVVRFGNEGDVRGTLGVIINNNIQFYEFDESWEHNSDMDFIP